MRFSLVVPKNLELGIGSKGTVSERKQVRITGQENRNVDEDIVDVYVYFNICLYSARPKPNLKLLASVTFDMAQLHTGN